MKRLLFLKLVVVISLFCLTSSAQAANNPTQIRFIVSHADCGGTGTFEFFVNGLSVGVYSSTQGCVCNTAPLVVTLNDPTTLSLIGPAGCTLVSMTLNDPDWGVALGYVRVEINRTESGTETFCLVDYAGGTCGDRNLCDGYNFPGTFSYSNFPDCQDTLNITPIDGLTSSGYQGGPFAPVSKDYTLKNNSSNSLDWTAAVTVPWLNVSPGAGTLEPSQSAAVTVSINTADANSLAAGSHNTGVRFTNLISNSNQMRSVILLVNKIFYVDPNGNDSNPGTIDSPFQTIGHAVGLVAAGDIIYVRGGTYTFTDSSGAIALGAKSGTSANHRCSLIGYNGERPLLDFSAMTGTGADGIRITGSYWYVKGMDCFNAPHNGIRISGGTYNIVEFCRSFENRNSGVQLNSGASYNQIINCDSYYNYDAPTSGGNADGFSTKMDVGTGNYYYGCRSWQNSDDAYDGYLRGTDNVSTTFENCWAFKAGYLKDANSPIHGNGNGFKMGGGDGSNSANLRHNVILKNCLAFQNLSKGFDQNHDKGSMTLYNCTAFGNGANYNITEIPVSGHTATVTNCVSYTGGVNLGGFVVQITDSWQSPFVVTSADFNSIDPAAAYGLRNADGSLPNITFMHLAAGSDLIDGGTDVNLPWCGSAPDLGCFEYKTGIYPGAANSPTPTNGATGVSNTQDLSWTAGADTTSHDVYFGTVNPPPLVSNSQTDTTFDTGTMVQGIVYYWRIYEKNADCTTPGPLWSFTTAPPPLPGTASNPTPANGETGVSQTQDISWTAGSGIVNSHDVYFGTVNPPPLVSSSQTGTTYDTGTMTLGATYYWRINEKNLGGTTTGIVWHFTIAPPPPPGQATNPTPTNGATNVSQTQDLIWTAGTGIVNSHDVYFGTAASPPLVSSNQTTTSYDTGIMTLGTTYYWRIDEKNFGGTTTGTVWSFTTTAVQNVIIDSWVTGTTHAKATGTNRGLIFVAHGRHNTADPNLTAVTYGGQSMTKIIAKLQPSTSGRPYVAAFYLNEAGIAAASSDTFITTWTNPPPANYFEYTSAFVGNVNQTTSIGATASNATNTGTGDTIATSALTTAAGDMVIEASANTASGAYTANNGFTKDFESSNPNFGAMDGHKTAIGVPETPSVTHEALSSRKVLIGFVVNVSVPPPDAASNPMPANGATNVSLTQDLNWTAGAGAASHDVYFGTDNPPPSIGNQTAVTYDTGTMASLTTYYWHIDERNSGGTNTGPVWSFTTEDTMPPTPNPMTWAIKPKAISSSSISMTATTASDISGVEYYFANLTDPNYDSGWVSSPYWIDTGLAKNKTYTYIVFAQDKSTRHNPTDPSNEASATTRNYDCSSSHIASDLDNNCQVDFLDYYIMAETWAGDRLDILQFAEDWLQCNRIPADQCWQ